MAFIKLIPLDLKGPVTHCFRGTSFAQISHFLQYVWWKYREPFARVSPVSMRFALLVS